MQQLILVDHAAVKARLRGKQALRGRDAPRAVLVHLHHQLPDPRPVQNRLSLLLGTWSASGLISEHAPLLCLHYHWLPDLWPLHNKPTP